MAKTRASKIKQVVTRAKRKNTTPAPVITTKYNTGRMGIDALPAPVEPAKNSVKKIVDDVEFNIGDSESEARAKAVAGSERVAFKMMIRQIVTAYSERIEERLTKLSNQMEVQLQPLVRSITDIASAKQELSQELLLFEDQLTAALNLDGELDPIDIEAMFAVDAEGPVKMARSGIEPLSSITAFRGEASLVEEAAERVYDEEIETRYAAEQALEDDEQETVN